MYIYFIVITSYQEYPDPLVEVGKASLLITRPSKISSKNDLDEIIEEYSARNTSLLGKKVMITHISFLHEI